LVSWAPEVAERRARLEELAVGVDVVAAAGILVDRRMDQSRWRRVTRRARANRGSSADRTEHAAHGVGSESERGLGAGHRP